MSFRCGRPVRDEADALACIGAAAAAGQSLYSWSRANDVSQRSLYRWRAQLSLPSRPARFVEFCSAQPPAPVPNPPAQPPFSPPASAGARYELLLGDVTLRVGDDFADATLSRLLRAVRAC